MAHILNSGFLIDRSRPGKIHAAHLHNYDLIHIPDVLLMPLLISRNTVTCTYFNIANHLYITKFFVSLGIYSFLEGHAGPEKSGLFIFTSSQSFSVENHANHKKNFQILMNGEWRNVNINTVQQEIDYLTSRDKKSCSI